VAAYVKQIKGSIGYVEFSYALQNKLTFSRLKNAAGNFVQPRDETFQAAAAGADWANAKDFHLVMTDAPGENSWPIAATNFILMYKQPKDVEGAKAAKEFFKWVYANGDEQAKKLDYVPLPDALVAQIEAYWSQNMAY
jgi:phosphate transport system substrate-binding protein